MDKDKIEIIIQERKSNVRTNTGVRLGQKFETSTKVNEILEIFQILIFHSSEFPGLEAKFVVLHLYWGGPKFLAAEEIQIPINLTVWKSCIQLLLKLQQNLKERCDSLEKEITSWFQEHQGLPPIKSS